MHTYEQDFKAATPLLAKVTTPKLHIKFAQAKEKQGQVCVRACVCVCVCVCVAAACENHSIQIVYQVWISIHTQKCV
jgi:hypothetical protein